jgi:hypothetical protein
MIRRTSEQWLALFDQCKASGLTQTEFAKQHGIDPSYFSLRKRQLLALQQDDNDGFVVSVTTTMQNAGVKSCVLPYVF